jgi:hypothetical protein
LEQSGKTLLYILSREAALYRSPALRDQSAWVKGMMVCIAETLKGRTIADARSYEVRYERCAWN